VDVTTRILVVDDEISIRMLLQEALGRMGWEVDAVEDAEEGLARFHDKPYDLMIVDKNLPGMSGVVLISRIHQENDEVCFFMITAAPTVESAMETLEIGIEGYILKPFELLTVMQVVRDAVEKIQDRKIAAFKPKKLDAAKSLAPALNADEHFREASRQMRAVSDLDLSVPKRVLRILVIAPDDAERRWMHRYFAEGSDHKVASVASAGQVVDQLEREKPDLIVADAVIDDPNIFELVARSRELLPQTEFFVISENPSVADVTRLIELRATAVITKPLSKQGFEAKIRPVVGKLVF
jgi:DNA-binding response OmpR family regulator